MSSKSTIVLMIFASFAVACVDVASLTKEAPQQRRYVLEAEREARLPAESSLQLEVENFHVASAYASRSFVYRTDAAEVESDFYNEFHLAPGEAISQVLRGWLGDSGLFRSVRAKGSRLAPDLILEGDVTELYGDYRGELGQAVCTISFILIDARNSELLFQEEFAARSELSDNSPGALVEGWDRCLAELLGKLEGKLRSRR